MSIHTDAIINFLIYGTINFFVVTAILVVGSAIFNQKLQETIQLNAQLAQINRDLDAQVVERTQALTDSILRWAQTVAEKQSRSSSRVVVCATSTVMQHCLTHMIEASGASVVLRTSSPEHLTPLLDAGAVEIVATTDHEFAAVRAHIRAPLLCMATTLVGGLTVSEETLSQPVAIVARRADVNVSSVEVAAAIASLRQGTSFIAASVQAPFASLRISPAEHEVLLAEVRGWSTPDITARLRISAANLRQRRHRLRERLGIPEEQPLVTWSEMWWQAHMDMVNAEV